MAGTGLSKRLGNSSPAIRHPFQAIRQEMDELFGEMTRGLSEWTNGPQAAAFDLAETENTLELKMDLPGLKPEEIQLDVTGDRIRISGEHREESEEKNKTFHRVERSQRSFFRVVDLPCSVSQEEIVAELNNGVLTVTMPKCEEAKCHKIAVKG